MILSIVAHDDFGADEGKSFWIKEVNQSIEISTGGRQKYFTN